MIHKKQIFASFKKITQAKRALKSPTLMHPVRDWVIGLVAACALFSASAGWSSYIYLKNQDITVDQLATDENDVMVYKKTAVTKALDNISKQAKDLDQLLGQVVTAPALGEAIAPLSTTTVLENREDDLEIETVLIDVIESATSAPPSAISVF